MANVRNATKTEQQKFKQDMENDTLSNAWGSWEMLNADTLLDIIAHDKPTVTYVLIWDAEWIWARKEKS